MTRGGGLLFGAALAAVTIYAARKLLLALDTFEDALEDGLSEKSFGDWPCWAAGDGKGFHAPEVTEPKGQDNDA